MVSSEEKPNPAQVLAFLNTEYSSVSRPTEEAAGPTNDTQIILFCFWQEVLGLQQIAVRENFFGLGGDSLQMVRIAARVRERWSVELSFKDFFNNPTIEQLADIIDARRK